MPKIIERNLIEEFKDREFFTRDELFSFYQLFEPELKEGTFGWRIHDLKNRDIIKPVKRGKYIISQKPGYKPEISPALHKVIKLITERFNDVRHCFWEASWLNEFSRHQTNKSLLIIETEKGFEESLFYTLKDSQYKEVFLNPDEKTIELYIAESSQPIVIKKLLTRSPLINRSEKKIGFNSPALEKILVDIFAEERLFYFVQGSELAYIYESALSNYTINFTKMFSYAKRRDREQDIRQFMINHMPQLVNEFIDD